METNLEQCPLCGSELSQTKFREIRAKLRGEEEKKAAELAEAKLAITRSLEQEFKKQFEQDKRAAEKKLRDEAEEHIKKAVAGREQVEKQLKDTQARVGEIQKAAQLEIEKQRQEAEKKAHADAQQELKKVTAERDATTKKLKQAEDREAEIRKQAEEQAEKERKRQLLEQREALEKDKNLALLKQEAEHNRNRDSLQKKVKMMEHQLAKKTANELGDGGEIDVFQALRDAFQGDKITRIQKGQPGADILHEVLYKGDVCGRIVVDSKNRQAWQNTFVSKLRQDQVEAKAEHAILATTVFPAGRKEMCIESDVIVISPARVIYVTELLRQAMITMHIKGLSLKERSTKMSQLYDLITSEAYSKKFAEAEKLAQDVLDLDVQEQKDHGITWRKRGQLTTRIKNVLRNIETDVAAVIEAGQMEPRQAIAVEPRRAAS
jgi:hypothetical protein